MITNISGFPEFLPKEQIAFNRIVDLIRKRFELYGFSPLDTAAVEKVDTLLSKGNDNEIYGIHRLASEGDSMKRDLGLRFDLTVPLARYVGQHYGQLTFPYRRYHIAPVWRGERAQAGRYRQFYQCDIDIVGDGNLSHSYDAELLFIIQDVFKAIGLERFVIKLNNRSILTGLLRFLDVKDEVMLDVIRVIDKMDKITRSDFQNHLRSNGLSEHNISLILELKEASKSGKELLTYLNDLCSEKEYVLGFNELEEVLRFGSTFGIDQQSIRIDPTLARGLNYYTGTIFEVELLDYPELGSICGGGRYADLVGLSLNKKFPGVGMSIGISRLFPKLLESGAIKAEEESTAQIIITTQNARFMNQYAELASLFRKAGLNTELYLENKPLGAQMKYAGKKGFTVAIIADQVEFDADSVIIRDLRSGEQNLVSKVDMIEAVVGLMKPNNRI